MDIFSKTPDRYLYAPGFAWIFSIFGFLTRNPALILFSILKMAMLGHVLFILSRLLRVSAGVLALGALFESRSLIIDFQYGQVNTFIVWACVWALSVLLSGRVQVLGSFFSALALGAVSVIKLVPASIAAGVFLSRPGAPKNRRFLQVGVVVGAFWVLFMPIFDLGPKLFLDALSLWLKAMHDRGLPLETHNQSLIAFVIRWFSGTPSPVILLCREVLYGWKIFDHQMLQGLAPWILVGGSVIVLFAVLRILRSRETYLPTCTGVNWRDAFSIALIVSFAILPLHLAWKPYFVFGIPLSVVVFGRLLTLIREAGVRSQWRLITSVSVLFLAVNMSNYEAIGRDGAAVFEAVSGFYWVHLGWIFLGFKLRSRIAESEVFS